MKLTGMVRERGTGPILSVSRGPATPEAAGVNGLPFSLLSLGFWSPEAPCSGSVLGTIPLAHLRKRGAEPGPELSLGLIVFLTPWSEPG